MIRVVAGALMLGECVLLGQRKRSLRYGGCWEFPGGKVEPGETDQDALVREWQEELGVSIGVGSHLATIGFPVITPQPFEVALYSVQPTDTSERIVYITERATCVAHERFKWFEARDLVAGRAVYTAERVGHVPNTATPSLLPLCWALISQGLGAYPCP